jgi:hypothetical protein
MFGRTLRCTPRDLAEFVACPAADLAQSVDHAAMLIADAAASNRREAISAPRQNFWLAPQQYWNSR